MTDQEDSRPNPDQLLSAIKRAEEREGMGRLKVFLGMVAGVGKTFAMLQAAQQLKAQGQDVVVGWVDTHGRKATAEMLENLVVLPRKKSTHRGIELEEMDLEAILARKPSVVLVDELAHSNAIGSRHTKRYLDVVDILKAGIDVYSTLNVQHLESRCGIVKEITGVSVHETVPDSILDQADEIILIDLAPDELLKRLRDGAIYPSDRVETASRNFFKKVNLTALREIALRLATERVDRELRSIKVLNGIPGAWKSGSRLMVAIYASPYSESLIRWTRRLADLMDATWLGIYVESDRDLTSEEKMLLSRNMNLATQLGAEVLTTHNNDPVAGILQTARMNNVTLIVVGKSQRGVWGNFLRGGSIVSRLLRQSADIDVYVMASLEGDLATHNRASRRPALVWPWHESGWIAALSTSTCLIAFLLAPYVGYLAIGIIFLIVVSLGGLWLSRSSVLALAFIFALIHNYFFIPPKETFTITKPEDFLTLLMYFIAAASLGHLTSRLKRKESILIDRENRAITLYKLTKEIAGAQSLDEVIAVSIRNIDLAFGQRAAIILPGASENSRPLLHAASSFTIPEKDYGVAQWVLLSGKAGGHLTDTLPASEGIYFPLLGREKPLGALGIKAEGQLGLTADEILLAENFARLIASGIEREQQHEQGKSYEVMEETQKLYKTLLDSVSHELKTPLTAIKGSASALLDEENLLGPSATAKLASEILIGTDRLQRLVDNLLDMTRIDSGMLRPKRELCDVEDIIGSALRRVTSLRFQREIIVSIQEGIAPLLCDNVLLVQALMNILHNAYLYTPESSRIEVSARSSSKHEVELTIRDYGPGLPNECPDSVFQKFYRHAPAQTGGIGLGLSIARGLIEAQGGRISAGNHPEGGAVFRLQLVAGDTHDS